MNFRITLIHLRKFFLFSLIFISSFSFMQAEEVEQERYTDLTKALENPLDVFILDLSGQELTTLPKEIGQLKNLRELSLKWNQLVTLPKEIGRLQNLQALYLRDNQFTILPQEIGQLENLRELRLGNNQLSFEEKERIQKLLPKCKIDFEDLFIKQ
ncbi:leucine-rich repeat domain-containing protein [Leptospira noguchii]|uniref:Leucine rich repeat protein n=1 Tax=Leptospira noguchii TaxID=28182 RepID=M6VGB8_9LEPT|nr:leucine-rich repeat domain-containing protein [Leptospira noguchii]EMO55920.1 leucine rich repeat protein [Leptospira noguchii]